MLWMLAVFSVASVLVVPLTRWLGRGVFWLAALVPVAAFAHAVAAAPGVLAGAAVEEHVEWVPQLALGLTMRMDALSWVLTLVVTGVGALVLLYCAAYFLPDEEGLGRFTGVLLAFAGAMYGLVLADDVYLLFIMWEATTVFSYLLIGHYTGRKASRNAALQALLVTTLGGLTMLVGLVLLAVTAGTSRVSELVAAPPEGAIVAVAIMLILVGALSKSAIVPFHFWLPAAMAAPTPVSAYLHAAAMVKAGIYLIARFAPGYAELPGWREVLLGLGVLTMIVGGLVALRQVDLKLLLAYGTVSQLGFLTAVVGFGTETMATAGLTLLLAHALFKSALFLSVGTIDRRAGTRDLRKLSGLGREAPILATVSALALASMAGLPPLLGFVAKEAVFTGLLEAGGVHGWVVLVGLAAGSALTVAYSARFLWGAFARKQGVDAVRPVQETVSVLASPTLLAAAGLALGPLAGLVDGWVRGYADQFAPSAHPYHLALWHGLEPALGISALSLVLGLALFAWRGRSTADISQSGSLAGSAYWASMRFIDRTAARTTSLTQRGSLPFYLGVIFLVFVGAVGLAVATSGYWPAKWRLWDSPAQVAIGALMIIAAVAATRANKRFEAVVLVGVTGYGMATIFSLQGAPDLALTQALVEIVVLIAFVLVLRRLPARLGDRHGSVHRIKRALAGVAVGLTMATVAVIALAARVDAPISLAWPELAVEQGHGRNIVNVALVDLRGWDTMGELSVVIAAATGVASLIFVSTRADSLPRITRRRAREDANARIRRAEEPDSGDAVRGSWLLAGRTLAPRNRSILLEVVVRLIFHSLIVVSLYLLLTGHNTPGGGFAAGLVVGLALAARYLAGGRFELGAAAPFDAGKILGLGMILAAGASFVPVIFGSSALTAGWWELELGIFGPIALGTPTIFDIGVYLVVIGLVLDVLRSLGAEVDRQQELDTEGVASQ